MAQEMMLVFTGSLALDNRLSARTLGHTVPYLQRAVDKIIFYEQFGYIRKFSRLPANLYPRADLYIDTFEAGSVRIPLLNNFVDAVASNLRTYLSRPYQQAAHELNEPRSLPDQVDFAYNRVAHEIDARLTHADLINANVEREREWVQVAVLSDLNNMVAPLRSSKIADDDSLSLTVSDDQTQRTFDFDRQTAKRFGKIVTEKSLGPTAIYTGTLEGLNSNNSNNFPFIGNFRSNATNQLCNILIAREDAALALNRYNLSREPISIWAAPLTKYGAFDEVRGDIVFINFVQ